MGKKHTHKGHLSSKIVRFRLKEAFAYWNIQFKIGWKNWKFVVNKSDLHCLPVSSKLFKIWFAVVKKNCFIELASLVIFVIFTKFIILFMTVLAVSFESLFPTVNYFCKVFRCTKISSAIETYGNCLLSPFVSMILCSSDSSSVLLTLCGLDLNLGVLVFFFLPLFQTPVGKFCLICPVWTFVMLKNYLLDL